MSESDNAEPAPPAPRRALLFDPDLFFAVKVVALLKRIGFETTTVRRDPEWPLRVAEEGASIALVNTAARGLDWRAAIATARQAGLPVIAYGSHVDVETQAEVKEMTPRRSTRPTGSFCSPSKPSPLPHCDQDRQP